MPGQDTELDVLHQMFGPDDHAPAAKATKATKADGDKKVSLIDILKEAEVDVEKGGNLNVIESAEAGDADVDGADIKQEKKKRKLFTKARKTTASEGVEEEKKEKKPGFFVKVGKFFKNELYTKPVAFWSQSKDAIIVAMAVTVLCLVAAVTTLSIVTVNGSKNTANMQKELGAARASLNPNVGRAGVSIGRRENDDAGGLLSLTDGDLSTVALSPATTSDTCDDETSAVPFAVQSSVVPSVATMSTLIPNLTIVTATTVDVLTQSRPTVTAFMTTSSVLVPEITASASSSAALSSSTTIQTCGEWGDGAGPCARPYGSPNSTPEAWISALAAESLSKASHGIYTTSANTTFFPIGVPVGASSSSMTAPASQSSSVDAIVSILDEPGCAPTTTVYVTLTAAEPASSLTALSDGTIYATSTTETVYNNNNNSSSSSETVVVSAINGTGALTTATLRIPTYTLTLGSALPNGTAAPSGLTTVVSGGDKLAVPKPLGMSGSKSGNGVYCVVMLVALAALLN